MYHIPKNLAPNVNLSYCMDLWTLGSKLQTGLAQALEILEST